MISVIVPVYNVENYLSRCMESLLNQTYRNLQIILVDDGSTDKSGMLCDGYKEKDGRVEVFHVENGGASKARNIGLKHAKGEYISFVDSDDWIDTDMFMRLYEFLIESKTDISMCDYIEERSSGKRKKINHNQTKNIVMNKKDMFDYFYRKKGEKSNYSVCGKLIKREIFSDFKFIEGRMNEDIDACYHMFNKAEYCIFIDLKLYHYFRNTKSVTLGSFSNKDYDLLYIWDCIIQYVKEEHPEDLKYALINRKRSDFTLLTKMERDYFRGNTQLGNECRRQQIIVRNNMMELLHWKMPISRKILLVIVSYVPIRR